MAGVDVPDILSGTGDRCCIWDLDANGFSDGRPPLSGEIASYFFCTWRDF